jgi:hypothetical protein
MVFGSEFRITSGGGFMEMTRRTCIAAFAAAVAASSTLSGKETSTMREILEASQNEKKSVLLYVKGQTIGGLVVKMTADTAELRNREYSKIVVRIEAIDAAAMS